MHHLALVIGLTGLLAACGDDPPAQAPRKARAPAKAAAASVASAAANPANLPKKLQNLKPEDWAPVPDLARRLRDARDPFKPYVEDLLVPVKPVEVVPTEERLATKIQQPPSQLKLIGIITGKPVHEAMVVDAAGLGHTVRQGDMVGDEVPYRVTRITRNEVLFQPIQPPTAENKLEDVRLILLTQEELEEQTP